MAGMAPHSKGTSDLAAVAGELTFGGNPDYIEREDGFGMLSIGMRGHWPLCRMRHPVPSSKRTAMTFSL